MTTGLSLDSKKPLLFLIIMKLHASLKNGAVIQSSDDLDLFFQFLRNLALLLTKDLDESTINLIETLKSNVSIFK